LPTPGRASSCSIDAVFRSTVPADALLAAAVDEVDDVEDFEDFEVALDDDFSAFGVFAVAGDFELSLEVSAAGGFSEDFTRPAFACGLIFSMVDSGTPARERSLIEEYGRLAMILVASAGPMPGSVSSCCCDAVLTSTFSGAAEAVTEAARTAAMTTSAIRMLLRTELNISTSCSFRRERTNEMLHTPI